MHKIVSFEYVVIHSFIFYLATLCSLLSSFYTTHYPILIANTAKSKHLNVFQKIYVCIICMYLCIYTHTQTHECKYFSVYVHIQKQNKQHNQPHIYMCIYRFYCLSVRNDLALRTFFWILIFSLINILENSSSK